MKLYKTLSFLSKTVVAIFLLLAGVPVAAQNGEVQAVAVPSDSNPSSGADITVDIDINMSGVHSPDEKLGSFTVTLEWDPEVLFYVDNSGLMAGFTGVINDAGSDRGSISFNGINPEGVGGRFTLLTITFTCDTEPSSTTLDLEILVMAAAFTFTDLLPILTVVDGHVRVSSVKTEIPATDLSEHVPSILALDQNFPNPFNAETVFGYHLSEDGDVTLAVFDILGRKIKTVVMGHLEAGSYTAAWDGRDEAGNAVTSGTYVYRLEVEDVGVARKMSFLR